MPHACCKLCICEAVDGTTLCRDHLEGYLYAVDKLCARKKPSVISQSIADWLLCMVKQPSKEKGKDNG